jgi:hypothetical protein
MSHWKVGFVAFVLPLRVTIGVWQVIKPLGIADAVGESVSAVTVAEAVLVQLFVLSVTVTK